MDFLSRLIGGVGGAQSRKANPNSPQQRLARFKKAYGQTLQIWHKISPSKPDNIAIETLRTCLQRLTTLLHDDTRAPAPHLCLSFAASSQFYVTITNIATSLNNEDITREAVAWFSSLVDNDEENLLADERFAGALMTFADTVSGSSALAPGSQTEGEILELMFGIAAKIRLEPDLLPVWFLSEDRSSAPEEGHQIPPMPLGDRKRFPLCYQFVGSVYNEGRAGDFARTGLLYIFESVSHSPELNRWIIESDLPTLMASGLGALYSQLSRKLSIAHPRESLPLILALSDNTSSPPPSLEVDNFYSEELQSRLTTFMSNLIFWQDILEHCRSLEIKQTLIDHFQVFFLQQILYPSLLESSDIDGGSSVAVLTYLWRILDSVDHPDLMHLILDYLLALSDPAPPASAIPRSPAAEKRRESLLFLSQVDGGEDKLSPSFFNLTDLILASVQSANAETVTAALRLITVLLIKHHAHSYSSLLRTSLQRAPSSHRNYGMLQQDLNLYATLMQRFDGGVDLNDAYGNCTKDALTLVESHVCTARRLGMRKAGFGLESRHRSAILEDQSRIVHPHSLQVTDPLLESLLHTLSTFFTNSIETNLGLTNVLTHLAACPYTSLEGWLVIESSKYQYNLGETQLTNPPEGGKDEDAAPEEEDMDKAEEARFGAFKAACAEPSWQKEDVPPIIQAIMQLGAQLDIIRKSIPDLDHLVASRKRALEGATEIENDLKAPTSAAISPRPSMAASRESSRSRAPRTDATPRSAAAHDSSANTARGRAIDASPIRTDGRHEAPQGSPRPSRAVAIRPPGSPSSAHRRKLSASPSKFARALSPLAAMMTASEEEPAEESSRASSKARSADIELFERKLRFPPDSTRAKEQPDPSNTAEAIESEEGSNLEPADEDVKEASLTHVLTNIVILQEFVLELMALVQVRASLLDGEVEFQ